MKGICPSCREWRWLGGKGRRCKPCAYPRGVCGCGHVGRIYVDGLCYCCYSHRQVAKRLDAMQQLFQPKSEYNQHLFSLYLTYIRRYRLFYFHAKQAARLRMILEREAWPRIRNHADIYALSAQYPLLHPNGKANGCAVKKIGFMLEELGVLAANADDLSYVLARVRNRFRAQFVGAVDGYSAWLRKSGRTDETIYNNVRHVLHFDDWLGRVYPRLSLSGVTENKGVEFLTSLTQGGKKPSYARDSLLRLCPDLPNAKWLETPGFVA